MTVKTNAFILCALVPLIFTHNAAFSSECQASRSKKRFKVTSPKQRLSAKQRASALTAVAELGKLKSATTLGVSYEEYHSRLINASAAISEVIASLPAGRSSSDVKPSIVQSLQAYVDADTVWGRRFKQDNVRSWLLSNKAILTKYGIYYAFEGKEWPAADARFSDPYRSMEMKVYLDVGLSFIWLSSTASERDARRALGLKTS